MLLVLKRTVFYCQKCSLSGCMYDFRVHNMLQERSQHAQAVADVYMMATEIVRLLSDDHPFQVKFSF